MHDLLSTHRVVRLRRVVVVVSVATVMSTIGWLPPARGDSIPPTITREVALPLAPLATAPQRDRLSVSSGVLRSTGPTATAAATVCAPIQFTAVGLAWHQTAGGDIHAAIKSGDRATDLGQSTVVESDRGEGPDVTSPEYHAERRSTALLWTGEARCMEFSLELPDGVSMSGLRAVFINTSGTSAGGDSDSTAATSWGSFGAAPADAMTTRPGLVSREQWGADESLRNCDPYYAPQLKMAFVHHTAGSNDYAQEQSDDIVRSIYWYHTEIKGWCDIAYNFLVDRFGTVYVGRAGGTRVPTVPGATQGFNTGSTAVAAMGNFMDVPPSSATVSSIKGVLAWRLDVAHLPATGWAKMVSGGGPNTRYAEGTEVWLRLISGHRRTGYTDCPGDNLHALLPQIRRAVYRRGTPKILRPSQSATSITPGIDHVRFRARASEELEWETEIKDLNGNQVRRFHSRGIELDVVWDGTDELGIQVLPGDYVVIIRGANAVGSTARRALLQVKVEPSSP